MTTDLMENDAVPEWALAQLSSESRECLRNLSAYRPPDLPDFGLVKKAAVLIALYERDGALRVVLTTRAKTLRRHPSQTALPGGKCDPEDLSALYTARREAFEEVNLPQHPHSSIVHLTTLDPVMTILPLNAHFKNHIVVIPVVCFISDPALIEALSPNPAEVDRIFTHPLKGCLDGFVEGKDKEQLVEIGGEWWPHEEEFHSVEDRIGAIGGYRMHRFRTSHSPIKGLTSDILIHAASVAYNSPPRFSRFASQQPPFSTAIANVVLELPGILESSKADSLVNASGEKKILEWGGTEKGQTWRSAETYEVA